MRRTSGRALLGLLTVAVTALAAAGCQPAEQSADQRVCDGFEAPVFGGTDPVNQSTFLTTSPEEAAALTSTDYTSTEHLGPYFLAAPSAGDGLLEVHRLYRAKNKDYSWSADQDEIATEVENGYVDQGVAFHLAARPAACLVPVHRFVFRGQHRLVLEGEESRLEELGWKDEGIKFHAGRSSFSPSQDPGGDREDQSFTFAVIPDTQLEVVRAGDTRTRDRSVWLVENQARLNLTFMVHTGDIVDSPVRKQFQRARRGLAPLQALGLPYMLAVGNNDTAARCSVTAADACSSPAGAQQIRDTAAFNNYFGDDIGGLQGQFEKGKLDNAYTTYEAGGLRWLVLTIEGWPRPAAVQWADRVVAEHPHANVIVATHMYLTPDGEIGQSNGGFGADATAPQYLFDHLIKRHENIKMVLSGHTGAAAHRTDKGVRGNTVYSFLGTFHDPKHSPTRLVEVDPAGKKITSRLFLADNGREIPGGTVSFDGVDLTR